MKKKRRKNDIPWNDFKALEYRGKDVVTLASADNQKMTLHDTLANTKKKLRECFFFVLLET